jgi:predicted nucleotidyltransferase
MPISFDKEKTRRFLREREEKREAELTRLFEKAQRDFSKVVDLIKEKYRPKRIYTWGSLLDRKTFSKISDIDIAVEGLAGPLEGLHAKSDAEDLTDFPVDLVELERIHPLHAETIRERGKLIYERE